MRDDSKTTILVAEDDVFVLDILQWTFKQDRFLRLLASDGPEALRIARELTRSRPHLRVILMSGYPQGVLKLDRGWHFLSKPFLPGAILEKVELLSLETVVAG